MIIKAMFDTEANIWLATSDDVSGLAFSAESLNRLCERLPSLIRLLMKANHPDKTAPETYELRLGGYIP